jgi:glycosyltransferase involved in cell wall biosynthesis
VTSPHEIALIPAFNEAPRLPAILQALEGLHTLAEIVVIDDGSTDGTGSVAERHGVTLLRHSFNLGYGAALQTGYKYALERGAHIVVQLDADGQHDPAEIPSLVRPLRDDEADLVLGSRFLSEGDYRMGRIRTLGRLIFQRLARAAGLRVTDPTSGFQAMNRRVLELYTREFFPSDYPDVDVLLVAHRRGLRIRECPVHVSEGQRPSTLHGGLRSVYYLYRLALSLWAGLRRSPVGAVQEERDG